MASKDFQAMVDALSEEGIQSQLQEAYSDDTWPDGVLEEEVIERIDLDLDRDALSEAHARVMAFLALEASVTRLMYIETMDEIAEALEHSVEGQQEAHENVANLNEKIEALGEILDDPPDLVTHEYDEETMRKADELADF